MNHESERIGVQPLVSAAQPDKLWVADRHFCTQAILGWGRFLIREQAITARAVSLENGERVVWRRIQITFDTPAESGESQVNLRINLPDAVQAEHDRTAVPQALAYRGHAPAA